MCEVTDVTGTAQRHCKMNNLTLLGDVLFAGKDAEKRTIYAFRAQMADGKIIKVQMTELSDRYKYEH